MAKIYPHIGGVSGIWNSHDSRFHGRSAAKILHRDGEEKMVVHFITVGTGVGETKEKVIEAAKSQAHGILVSIFSSGVPEEVVFFCSEQSKTTVDYVMDWYRDGSIREAFPKYHVVINNRYDEFNACFRVMHEEYKKYADKHVMVNYTFGTKTMTMSAAIFSLLNHCTLCLVDGERVNGLVQKGTERVVQQNLFQVYDLLLLEKALTLFNKFSYQSALDTLDQTCLCGVEEEFRKIIMAYDLWDRLYYKRAERLLQSIVPGLIPEEYLKNNKAFLGTLVGSKELREKYTYVLADLINNAERRIRNGRYDDAVARLYRSIELISQILLLDCGINDIDAPLKLDSLKGKIHDHKTIRKYEALSQDGVVRIGVQNKYLLLDKLGKREAWEKYKSMRNLMTQRNTSILAHGLEPVSALTAQEMLEGTLECAGLVHDSFQNLRELAFFPQLHQNEI